MLLHRIDDPASALSREPHKGYLTKAVQYAPAGASFSSFAGKVLHGELLAYSVARKVVDPEGLLLLEMDPDGAAVNIAVLTLRPGSRIFGEMLAELWGWAKALGFYRLECRSRRPGMQRFLAHHNWRHSGIASDFGIGPPVWNVFGYHGPSGAIKLEPKPERCGESGQIVAFTAPPISGPLIRACPACGAEIQYEVLPDAFWAGVYAVPEHFKPAPAAPTMADLPEDFPYFMGDAR